MTPLMQISYVSVCSLSEWFMSVVYGQKRDREHGESRAKGKEFN
jgi:hypothetical protein